MTTNLLTTARYALTVVLAGLTATYSYYPKEVWIPIAITALMTLGIHVVPTKGQLGPRMADTHVAATFFQALLLGLGAELSPRDPQWLDYAEPKNVFTRHYDNRETVDVQMDGK